jgi:hypothetical protein
MPKKSGRSGLQFIGTMTIRSVHKPMPRPWGQKGGLSDKRMGAGIKGMSKR